MAFALLPRPTRAPAGILKWVGSKGWLTDALAGEILPILAGGGRYVEPFLGSGALFFALRAYGWEGDALLSDVFHPLLDMYQAIWRDPTRVDLELRERAAAGEGEWDFYAIRHAFNLVARGLPPFADPVQAARFLYLSHRGFNGLWRTNKRGECNVPWGGIRRKPLPSLDHLLAASRDLSGAELRCCDFEEAISEAGAGDVVYADPPYVERFTAYAGGFCDVEQMRLRRCLHEAWERGAAVLASNSDTPLARSLYDAPPFAVRSLRVIYRVGGLARRWTPAREILITANPGA
jgi:DNA adenine methylase